MSGGNGQGPGKQPTPMQLELARLENRALLLTDRIEALVHAAGLLERQAIENLTAFNFQVEESNQLERVLRDVCAAVSEHVRRGRYGTAVPEHLQPYLEQGQAELKRRADARAEALERIKALHAGETKQ
jgi:hypothetical protein